MNLVRTVHMFLVLLGSTYGSGSYNAGPYNASSASSSPSSTPAPLVQIGPLSLPDTGAGWAVIIGAAVVAIAAGWMVWIWQKRRHRLTATQ
jgi:LPXTG-motif cell wall-anchored protein